MEWTGNPPAEPGEFAEVYEKQVQRALEDGDGKQPATPPAIAREYEKQLERAREQAYREARDFFVRRAYERDLTQQEVAELANISQPRVSEILKNAPDGDPRATPADD